MVRRDLTQPRSREASVRMAAQLRQRDNVREAHMATTDNNLHVLEDLLDEAQRMAQLQGRTTDALAADALKRYLGHEWLNKVAREGQERRRSEGLKSDDDVERVVERAIAHSRSETRRG